MARLYEPRFFKSTTRLNARLANPPKVRRRPDNGLLTKRCRGTRGSDRGALTRIVRRNREERRRECENPDAGSRVTGYFDAFVERAPTQRGFNYADITVIKPINACYCAPSGGPQRFSRFLSTVPTTSLLRTPQKHLILHGDTRTHPACSRIFTATTSPPWKSHDKERGGE